MELLTVQETAALLKLSPVTIRRYVASGRLPAVKVGRGVRIRKEAIVGLLEPVVPTHLRDDPEDDPSIPKGRPLTRNSALFKITGMFDSGPDGPTDGSTNEQAPAPADHSLLRIAAMARTDDLDGGPSDIASDKYAYLDEACSPGDA